MSNEKINKETKPIKPNYFERYKRISKTDWYIKAYKDKSLGELIIIDNEKC